jgi:hypothetical protein
VQENRATNDVLQALANRELVVFKVEELDEFVQGIYILLRVAVRQECDTFTIDTSEIIWSRGGIVIGSFPLILRTQSIYPIMRASLLKIIERDSVVRQHLQRIEPADGRLAYKIVYDQD